MTSRFLVGIIVALVASTAAQAASTLPLSFSYTGQLTDSTDAPVLDNNIRIRVQIYNPAQNCLLYEEEQYVDTTPTNGNFNLNIGSPLANPKRTGSDPGLAMSQIFQNTTTVRLAGADCSITYVPAAGDGRYLRTTIVSTTLSSTAEVLTAQLIQSVPYATTADTLQGKEASAFIAASTNVTQPNLENILAGYADLMSLIAGTSPKYVTRAANQGASIPSYAVTPTNVQTGQMWFDTGSSTMKYYDGTAPQSLGSGLSPLGTAGTYTKVTTDAFGRVSSGTTLVEADIPMITTAGKVSGTAITSGTISGSTSISTSGNITTTGTISTSGNITTLNLAATNVGATNFAARNVQINDSAVNKVILITPNTLAADYTLTLPPDNGTANQVLQTDGNGILTWSTPAATGIATLTVNSPLVSTGGANPTITIPAATSTINGYLSSTDWTAFNSKLGTGLPDGSILVGSSANVATPRSPAGDVTMSNTGSFTVNKIKGVTVTGIPLANQFLKYDTGTTSWKPGNVLLGDLTSSIAGPLFASPNCTSEQTLSWNSITDQFTCITLGIDADKIISGTIASSRMPAFSGDVTSVAGSTVLTLPTVPVAKGGTGSFTPLNGNRLMVSSGTSIVEAPALTNGQIFVGSTGAAPAATSIIGMGGISVTPGAGTLTITGSGTNGTVTLVTAAGGTPLSVLNGGTTPEISITQANGSTNGYLTSTDWNIFSGKLSAITNTATLNSGQFWVGDGVNKAQPQTMTGDATLSSSGVLSVGANIPRKNTPNTFVVGGQEITNNAPATIPLMIRGAVGQTANLMEWQNSAGSIKAAIPFDGNPVASTDLATKGYVTTTVGNYVSKAGDSMSGPLTAAANGLILTPGPLSGSPSAGMLAIDGTSANTLKWYDGSGWQAVGGGGGTVTNVSPSSTGGNPISVTNGSTTPQIDISQANGSTNGYLTSTDWLTFNNKLSSVTPSSLPAFSGDVTSAGGTSVLTLATVPINKGGTNSTNTLNNNRLMMSDSGSIKEAPALTNGEIFIGSNGNAPVRSTLTPGTGIGITSAAGSITITNTSLNTDTLANLGCVFGEMAYYNGAAWSCMTATSSNSTNSVMLRDASMNFNANNATLNLVKLPTSSVSSPTFQIGNGSATGFASAATNELSLVTNGGARLHVLSNGNVGINTMSPSTNLDVNGNIKATSLFSTNNILLDSNNGIYPSSGTGSSQYPGSSNDLNLTNSVLNTDRAQSLIRGTVRNGSTNIQNGYMGFISNAGAGNYSPAIVFGVQTGASSYAEQLRIENGSVRVQGQISSASFDAGAFNVIDFNNGNSQTTAYDCAAAMQFVNLRDGGSYTVVVTGTGTNQCNFNTVTTGSDAATVTYRYKPTNGMRTSVSHTIYSLMRINNTVYVSWSTGF